MAERLSVPLGISFYLGDPEFAPGVRLFVATRTFMPKAPMNENNGPSALQENVGVSIHFRVHLVLYL